MGTFTPSIDWGQRGCRVVVGFQGLDGWPTGVLVVGR